jgi:hypothetical protein
MEEPTAPLTWLWWICLVVTVATAIYFFATGLTFIGICFLLPAIIGSWMFVKARRA